MKKYLIPMVIMGLLVTVTIVNAKTNQPINKILKKIRRVIIVNENPIDVNVVNQQQIPVPKVATFFDNICNAPYGLTSPIIKTEGYSYLWFFISSHDCLKQYALEVSLDGTNWISQDISALNESLHPIKLEVIGPQYRLRWTRQPNCPSCLTIQGYLK